MLFCLYDLFQSPNMIGEKCNTHKSPSSPHLVASSSSPPPLPLSLTHTPLIQFLRSAWSSSRHLVSSLLTLCIRLSLPLGSIQIEGVTPVCLNNHKEDVIHGNAPPQPPAEGERDQHKSQSKD